MPRSSGVRLKGLEHLRDAVGEIPTDLVRLDDDLGLADRIAPTPIPDAATIDLLKTKREQRRAADSELFIPLRGSAAEERCKYGESRLVREDDEDDGAFAECTHEHQTAYSTRVLDCVRSIPCRYGRLSKRYVLPKESAPAFKAGLSQGGHCIPRGVIPHSFWLRHHWRGLVRR